MKQKFRGFTIIELVTVIVLLGIIAGVAIPRFANVTSQAKISAINGMLGAVKAAAISVHAQAIAEGKDCTAASGQSINVFGQSVALAYCYPISVNSGGIDNALNSSGFLFGYGTGTAVIELLDSTGAGIVNCQVNYTQPAAANTFPNIQALTGSC